MWHLSSFCSFTTATIIILAFRSCLEVPAITTVAEAAQNSDWSCQDDSENIIYLFWFDKAGSLITFFFFFHLFKTKIIHILEDHSLELIPLTSACS